MMRTDYLEKLTALLRAEKWDAMLLCPSEELRFFAGFSPLMCERFQGLFLKQDGRMFYFCNLLTGEEVRAAAPDAFPVYTWFDNDIMTEEICRIFEKEGLTGGRIAVNSTAQAFNILDIAVATGTRFENGVPLLEQARICKTQQELDCLRRAAAIADQGFLHTLPHIRPGMTEGEIHDILVQEMEALGGSGAGALVASGPNAGYPHYSGSSRAVQPGDCIIMDFGCLYHGLHSDMTRTIFLEPVPAEARRLYWLLHSAQAAAEDAAREGAFVPDIDAAARAVLEKAGLAHTCTTRIGHGIGYMTHEAPYINAHNAIRLRRGMCFSIEPGIYLPGRLGIRIEDIVAIGHDGRREVLNRAEKRLISVGAGGIHTEPAT